MRIHITCQHLLVASLSAVWLILLGLALWTEVIPLTPVPDEKIAIEHEKLRRLLGDFDAIERDLRSHLNELTPQVKAATSITSIKAST
jgi:hypothetical protein